MKLPVPCAPEEEEVRAEGGGASGGERPGGSGMSGAGAPPTSASSRAGFDFVRRGLSPLSSCCVGRPRASSVAVTPSDGSSRALPRADGAAARRGKGSGDLQLAVSEQLFESFRGRLSGLIRCDITGCLPVISPEMFCGIFVIPAGAAAPAPSIEEAPPPAGSPARDCGVPAGEPGVGGSGGGGGDTGGGITGETGDTAPVSGTIGTGGAGGTTGVDAETATAAIAAPSTGTAIGSPASAFGAATAAARTAPMMTV